MSVDTSSYGFRNLQYFAGIENGLSPHNKKVVTLASQSQHHSVTNKLVALTRIPSGMFRWSLYTGIYGAYQNGWFSRANPLMDDSPLTVCTSFSSNVGRLAIKMSETSRLAMSFFTPPSSDLWNADIGSNIMSGLMGGVDAFIKCTDDRVMPIGVYKAANVVIPLINEYGQVMALAAAAGGIWYYYSKKAACESKEKAAGDTLYKTLQHRFSVAADALKSEQGRELATRIIENQSRIKQEVASLKSSLSDKQIEELVGIVVQAAEGVQPSVLESSL